MGFRVVWNVPMYVLEHGIRRGRDRFLMEVDFEMEMAASNIGSWVRGNHPWQNRTGDAERLFNVEYRSSGARRMIMEHGVYYGIYLETMQGGRYGILPGALTYGKPIVSEGLQRALDKAFSW